MTVKSTGPFNPGLGLQDGSAMNAALGYSAENSITALGTTQATSYQLKATYNVIGTTAANTGVKLPPPVIGADPVYVFNDGASTLKVYGFASDTINGVAGATGVSMLTTAWALFAVTDAGVWKAALLGAALAA